MDVKKLPDAVRIVNWRAHEDEFVVKALNELIRTGKFPDFGGNQHLFETFMMKKYGINFHITENYLASIAEEGGVRANVITCTGKMEDKCYYLLCPDDCPYLIKKPIEHIDADLNGHDLNDVINELTAESQKLYGIKARLCAAINAPVERYTIKNGRHLKVVVVEGYKAHLPVSKDEEKAIADGSITLVPDKERWPSRREFIDDASLEDAIAMINKRINECTH